MESVLSLSGLSLSRGGKQILSDINLELMPGKFTALLGPNGAGKSSLLKCLSQDYKPDTGRIELRGKALSDWPQMKLAKELAVLPQHSGLGFAFKAKDVVAFGLYPLTLNQRQGDVLVEYWLERLDITHLSDSLYPELSGGEKQRLHLARVLVQLAQSQKPPVLLLDEPTSALDLAQQHRVLSLLRQLASGQEYTIISVLHDLNQACQYCDELVVLSQGRIAANGTPRCCMNEDLIDNVWHYRPERLNRSADIPLYF
ncbi:MAG: heme ABC transporter ATP-binding protein [Shewanella sp.]|nr:heme ABC transporter ATP-binding protein [Shewanella sp.]MCF1431278.1 heme ABC transporter ATP-binding protein [Shewanella sp.]MCF1438606.1 heme ABC transporter ATP-binding protein [Shewanella sp.]MCF1457888.1 heme ABC transporter ATP-binding protein [Shewanella sp.]